MSGNNLFTQNLTQNRNLFSNGPLPAQNQSPNQTNQNSRQNVNIFAQNNPNPSIQSTNIFNANPANNTSVNPLAQQSINLFRNITAADKRNNQNHNRDIKREVVVGIKRMPYQELLGMARGDEKRFVELIRTEAMVKQLGTCFQQFQVDDSRKRTFETEVKTHHSFGLTQNETHFKNILRHNLINQFLDQLIKAMKELVNTDELICHQFLKRAFAKNKSFMQKFYQTINHKTLGLPSEIKINLTFLNSLYLTQPTTAQTTPKVNSDTDHFQLILKEMIVLFYRDYKSALQLLGSMGFSRNKAIQVEFRKRFIINDSFIIMAWKSFKKLTDKMNQKQRQPTSSTNNSSMGKLRSQNFHYQTRIVIILSVVLEKVINKFYNWIEKPISSLITPLEAIQCIDKTLVQNLVANLSQEQYQLRCLELLLQIIPFYHLMIRSQQPLTEKNNLSNTLLNTKSFHLKPVRILIKGIVQQHLNRRQRSGYNSNSNQNNQHIKQFEQLINEGAWSMESPQWKYWLGTFIDYNLDQILLHDQILNRIVLLCKEVVREESTQFWEAWRIRPRIHPLYYHQNIFDLIQKVKGSRSIRAVLPVLTECLGGHGNDMFSSVQSFTEIERIIDRFSIQDQIIEPIRATLNAKNDKRRGSPAQYQIENDSQSSRVNFRNFNRVSQMIDLELRFLTRMIEVYPSRLAEIEEYAMGGQGQRSYCGLALLTFLLNTLKVISSSDNLSTSTNLKCVRYIIRIIDLLYCKKETHQIVLYAICAHHEAHNNQSVDLQKIISFTNQRKPKANTSGSQKAQIIQEQKKLRKVLSNHLRNILKLTHTITADFPLRRRLDLRQSYQFLNTYIENGHFNEQYEWLQEKLPFVANTWFYELLYLLCWEDNVEVLDTEKIPQQSKVNGKELSPVDLESIRLILYKCRMPAFDQLQEYETLNYILQLLNSNPISSIVLKNLQPKIQKYKGQYYGRSSPLLHSLSNLGYDSILAQNISLPGSNLLSTDYQIETHQIPLSIHPVNYYDQIKKSKLWKESVDNVLGRIAGSMEIIETVLRIYQESFQFVNSSNNSGYVLLKKCDLYTDLISDLTIKSSIYHYQVSDHTKSDSKDQQQRQFYENRQYSFGHNSTFRQKFLSSTANKTLFLGENQKMEKDSSVNINLINVLSSYANFQIRRRPQIGIRYANKCANHKVQVITTEDYLKQSHQYTQNSSINRSSPRYRYSLEMYIRDEELCDNLLSQPMNPVYVRDYSIMGNTVRIFTLLVSLSLTFSHWRKEQSITGKVLLDCLNFRSYQADQSLLKSFDEMYAQEFYKSVIRILKDCYRISDDLDSIMIMKCQVYEFLGICLEIQRLGDVIVGNFLQQIFEAISQSVKNLRSRQLPLLNKIVFFMCLLVQNYFKGDQQPLKLRLESMSQGSRINFYGIQGMLGDNQNPIIFHLRYPTHLIRQALFALISQYGNYGKLSVTSSLNHSQNTAISPSLHHNLLAQKQLNLITMFKMTQDMLLELILMTFSSDNPDTIRQILNLLMDEIDIFVHSPINRPTGGVVQKLGLGMRHKLEIARGSNGIRITYQANRFLKGLWCSSNFTSYGRSYQYDPISGFYTVLFSSPSAHLEDSIMKEKLFEIYRANTGHSLYHAQQYLTQTYVALVVNLIAWGKYGHNFSDYEVDEMIPSGCINLVKSNRFQVFQAMGSFSEFGSGQHLQQTWSSLKNFLQSLLSILDAKIFETCSLDSLYFLSYKTFSQMQQIIHKTIHLKNNQMQHRSLAKRMLFSLPKGFSGRDVGLTLRGRLLLISSLVSVLGKLENFNNTEEQEKQGRRSPIHTIFERRSANQPRSSDQMLVEFYSNVNTILLILNGILKNCDSPQETIFQRPKTEGLSQVNQNLALICAIVASSMKPLIQKFDQQSHLDQNHQNQTESENSFQIRNRFDERHPVYTEYKKQLEQLLTQVLSIHQKYHEPQMILYPTILNTVAFATGLRNIDPSLFCRIIKIIAQNKNDQQSSQSTIFVKHAKRVQHLQSVTISKSELPPLPPGLLVWHYQVLSRITLQFPDWQSLIYQYLSRSLPSLQPILLVEQSKLTLLNILQFKHLSGLVVSLLKNNIDWRKEKYRALLQQLFSMFLKSDLLGIVRESTGKLECVTTCDAENYLRTIKVYDQIQSINREDRSRYRNTLPLSHIDRSRSISEARIGFIPHCKELFELVWRTRFMEGLRFYLLFLSSGFEHSEAFIQFYSKILFRNPSSYQVSYPIYDQITWFIISKNLCSIIAFLQSTLDFFTEETDITQKLLKLQAYISRDIDFGFKYSLLNSLFEPSEKIPEWIMLFFECADILIQNVARFLAIWKQYQWKATVQYQHERENVERICKNFVKNIKTCRVIADCYKDLQSWSETADKQLTKANKKKRSQS